MGFWPEPLNFTSQLQDEHIYYFPSGSFCWCQGWPPRTRWCRWVSPQGAGGCPVESELGRQEWSPGVLICLYYEHLEFALKSPVSCLMDARHLSCPDEMAWGLDGSLIMAHGIGESPVSSQKSSLLSTAFSCYPQLRIILVDGKELRLPWNFNSLLLTVPSDHTKRTVS